MRSLFLSSSIVTLREIERARARVCVYMFVCAAHCVQYNHIRTFCCRFFRLPFFLARCLSLSPNIFVFAVFALNRFLFGSSSKVIRFFCRFRFLLQFTNFASVEMTIFHKTLQHIWTKLKSNERKKESEEKILFDFFFFLLEKPFAKNKTEKVVGHKVIY